MIKLPSQFQIGQVCYLPLNEGSGLNAIELSNFVTGGTAPCRITTCVWSVTPRLGKCLIWASAVTNKVTIGKPSFLNLATSPMTISAWVYITDLSAGVNSGYRYICSDYNSGGTNAQFALHVTNSQKVTFFWANAGTQAPNPITGSGATTLLTNTLYHLVGVRSGTTGSWSTTVYVNGKLDGGTTTATNPATQTNAGNVTVGQAGDLVSTPLGMVGGIKSLRIWNRALSASEIKELYIKELNEIVI